MNKAWQVVGNFAFWLSWPAIWFVLRFFGRSRTRGIIIADGKVLLLKQWLGPGSWTLPGGGRKFGESARQCLIREIREETGLQIEDFQVRFFKQFSNVPENGIKTTFDCYIVNAPGQTSLILRRPEIVEAGWFTLANLADVKLSSATQQIFDTFDHERHLLK